MLETLIELDKELFLFINGLRHPVLDVLMPLVSNKLFWIPFYALLLYWVIRKKGWKTALVFAVTAGVATGLADFISVNAFKNVFERLRPCHEPSLDIMVQIINNKCGGNYGFVSSHAANHFALAMVFVSFFKQWKWKYSCWFCVWAAAIAYSRVYLGVHYPGDVIVGGLLGVVIAKVIFILVNKFVRH